MLIWVINIVQVGWIIYNKWNSIRDDITTIEYIK